MATCPVQCAWWTAGEGRLTCASSTSSSTVVIGHNCCADYGEDCASALRGSITHTIDVLIVGTLRRTGGREQCEWWSDIFASLTCHCNIITLVYVKILIVGNTGRCDVELDLAGSDAWKACKLTTSNLCAFGHGVMDIAERAR